MFILPIKLEKQFKSIYDDYILYIAGQNIFYQSIRMLKDKFKILDRQTYVDYYENILKDIELETSPLDCFVPLSPEEEKLRNEGAPNNTPSFVVNQNVPEYDRVRKRITLDDIYETFPSTHEIYCKLKDNPSLLSTIIDDCFIHFCLYRYLDEIEKMRLHIFSMSTPLVEYIVDNIKLNDINKYIVSNKIKTDKCTKYLKNAFFLPEFKLCQKFYNETHNEIDCFDIDILLQRLSSNIVLKSDIYIIIGIYITLSFAMTDIRTEASDSKCSLYVKDVISKI